MLLKITSLDRKQKKKKKITNPSLQPFFSRVSTVGMCVQYVFMSKSQSHLKKHTSTVSCLKLVSKIHINKTLYCVKKYFITETVQNRSCHKNTQEMTISNNTIILLLHTTSQLNAHRENS